MRNLPDVERQRELASRIAKFTAPDGPLDDAIDGYSADAEYDSFRELRSMAEELAALVLATEERGPSKPFEITNEMVQMACLAYGGGSFPSRMRNALEVVLGTQKEENQ